MAEHPQTMRNAFMTLIDKIYKKNKAKPIKAGITSSGRIYVDLSDPATAVSLFSQVKRFKNIKTLDQINQLNIDKAKADQVKAGQ